MNKMNKEIDWDSIKCTKCGNCCPEPPWCIHKTPDNLCDVHPTLVGKEIANNERGLKCDSSTPATLFACRVYCPPMVDKIEELTGVRAIPTPKSKGVVNVANFEEVWTAYETVHPFDRSNYYHPKPEKPTLSDKFRKLLGNKSDA